MTSTPIQIWSIIVLAIIGSSTLRGQQVRLNLKTALQYTLAHHAKVKKGQLDIRWGKEVLRESVSMGLPQVSASAAILNNPSLRTSLVPAEFFGGQPGSFVPLQFGTNWNAKASVRLNQMIFNKQWLLALEASKKSNDFYVLSLEMNKEEVVYQTAKLYFQIQLVQTQRGLLKANLDQVDGLLTLTRKQFDNGLAKKIDVDRLRVQQSNLHTQLKNLDLQLDQLTQALKLAMQMPLNTEIVLTDSLNTEWGSLTSALAQPAFQMRPALALLQVQQDLFDLDYRRWRAGYFPSVNLFAHYNYEWQANDLGAFSEGERWFDYSQVGVIFNFPLFDGLFKKTQMEKTVINKLKTAEDYRHALLAFEVQYRSAMASLQMNRNNLQTVLETQSVAREVFRIAQKRYKEGVAPITELLDAEASLRQAQTNYISTLAQIKLAEIDLLHTNGQLLQLVGGQ